MSRRRARPLGARVAATVLAVAATAVAPTPGASAATVPAGFSESTVAAGLANPTAMEIAPDGRLFVAEEGGALRVIKDGALLAAPFATLTTDTSGERGLLGVTLDPAFAENGYVYVYYTATAPRAHNRISRFTAAGDGALPGSERVLLELDDLTSVFHNGGALHFGPDGKLYAATGDGGTGANSQSLGNLLGKILRLNADGSIPEDNPFAAQTTGRNRAIWALGLRNPFNFAFEPVTGRMLVNDVGANAWEEVNEGVAGANYGWPETEGPTSDPRFRGPLLAYGHGDGCAITGGAFYDPRTPTFPGDFAGDYVYSDYCAGWIRRLDPGTGAWQGFATGYEQPVDQRVADDGALYVLSRGTGSRTGAVTAIRFAGTRAPTVTVHPADLTVAAGQAATFTAAASGDLPLTYQWQRDGVDVPGATSAEYTLASAGLADSGARLRVRVSNAGGTVVSDEALLTVVAGSRPVATITAPAGGARYRAGETIAYSGTATDAEDGRLPAAAFRWQVDFHHGQHVHPFVEETAGADGGAFTVPDRGETATDVFYRVRLTVTDSAGLSDHASIDLAPVTSMILLGTDPPGLALMVDGRPQPTPASITGVVGMIRSLGAPSPQVQDGTSWSFTSWSDGGGASHEITTPAVDSSYTAAFAPTPVVAFPADADARVESAAPAANFGRAWGLRAQGAADPDVESHLRFTVSDVDRVHRATLRLHLSNGSGDGPAVYATESGWSEADVTWDTRPARSSGALDDTGAVAAGTWLELDVTPAVTGNGAYAFVVASASADAVTMFSREHRDAALRPQLVVEATPAIAPADLRSTTFAADADARVESAAPAANYGRAWGLRAQGGSEPAVESHLRFTVSGVGRVQRATLRLHLTNGSADGPAVYATGDGWSEADVTWDTRAPRSSGALDDSGTLARGDWMELDVTAVVAGNGAYGFVVAGTSADAVTMCSREHGDAALRPQLMVTWSSS